MIHPLKKQKLTKSRSNIEKLNNTEEMDEFMIFRKFRSYSEAKVEPKSITFKRKSIFQKFFSFINLLNKSQKPNQRINQINVIMLVKRFIKLLKLSILKKKMKNLNSNHFAILNDKCCNPSHYKDLKKAVMLNSLDSLKANTPIIEKIFEFISVQFKFIYQLIYTVFKIIPVFDANKTLRIIWDAFMLIFLILNVINVPIAFSFQLDKDKYNYVIYNFVENYPAYFLSADILVNMNTSYYTKGDYEKNRTSIIRKYLKENFIFDILTIIPLFIGNYISSMDFIELVFVMRIFKLSKIIKKFEDFMLLRDRALAIVKFSKVIFLILFIANICGCIFHFVAIKEKEYGFGETWLDINNIDKSQWWVRYIYSLYWAVVTMITVGYGDIVPSTAVEKAISLVILIVGCGLFGYSINTVGTILQELSEKDRRQRKLLSQFCYFMQKRKVSRELQAEIRRYLEYKKDEDVKFSLEISNSFQNSLSFQLKKKYLLEAYFKLFKNYSIFSKHFSNETLKDLTSKITEQSFSPGDVIFEEGMTENRCIYFILRGEVNLMVGPQNLNLKTIGKNDKFGALCFFNGDKHEMTAVSKNLTQIAKLNFDDFYSLVLKNQDDFQKFCLIRDTLALSKEKIKIFCTLCDINGNHYVNECPQITFNKYSLKNSEELQTFLKKRLSCSEPNHLYIDHRKSITREDRKFNSLLNNDVVYFDMLKIVQDNDFNLHQHYYLMENIDSDGDLIRSDSDSDSDSNSSINEEISISKQRATIKSKIIRNIRRQSAFKLDEGSTNNRNNKEKNTSNKKLIRQRTSSIKSYSKSINKRRSTLKDLQPNSNECFDTVHNFKYYSPEANIEKIIKILDSRREIEIADRTKKSKKRRQNLLNMVSKERLSKFPNSPIKIRNSFLPMNSNFLTLQPEN